MPEGQRRVRNAAGRRSVAITRKAFLIGLGLFGACYLWLVALIEKWGVPRTPPIGGGSYSLDRFVYSALILLLASVWTLAALIVALVRADRRLTRRAWALAGIGLAALVAAAWAFGHNLH